MSDPTRTASHPKMALALLALVGGALVGCKTKPEPDYRPAWVQQAEARLQQPPAWQVSGSGVESGSENGPQSSFFGNGQPATAGSNAADSRERTAAAPSAPRKPAAAPPGVQWSETRITVSVEE